jgi:hypothetical protein
MFSKLNFGYFGLFSKDGSEQVFKQKGKQFLKTKPFPRPPLPLAFLLFPNLAQLAWLASTLSPIEGPTPPSQPIFLPGPYPFILLPFPSCRHPPFTSTV